MVQETISGFKKEGSWEEVVEYGEEITQVLENETDRKEFDEWDEWRPRSQESIDEDIPKKTAEKVSVDVDSSSDSLSDSPDPGDVDPEETTEGIGVKTAGKKIFSTVERAVYKNIMSKTGPCYFDNKLISANIKKKNGWIGNEEKFALEVDIYDSKLKERVRSSVA